MDRREFLGWVGVGAIASSLPVAIAACSRQNAKTDSSSDSARADGFAPVGTITDLDRQGQILNKEFDRGSILVIRNPSDPKNVNAVNPTCTHAGCTVSWDSDQKLFACPCHGSQFAPDGKVVQGPAEEPLTAYEAKLEGNIILAKKM
ncbi:cytochrome B6 [Hydrococcus rivularis NIES-593]|uniref:Cytochrome B6 n=1 Tax=Hydrococcus rivularis NIES-593 TaxID=1921803 RepID=A0A1U7HDE6_9CYAN|nr:ubiquinol-cytochrome c reductase iron-sulfur subunit [Hydrococcus rivularis]OKH21600.1 cytochrome B6 [Hydrococcus rivularis NIES-593]